MLLTCVTVPTPRIPTATPMPAKSTASHFQRTPDVYKRQPGIQTNRHRRCSLREPPEGAESQPRFFHTGAAARDDVGLVLPPVVIQQITPLSLLRRRPLADGKIFLFKCPGLHGGRECSSAPRRFCEYHQAAGLAVETMDGPHAARRKEISHAGLALSLIHICVILYGYFSSISPAL